MDWLFEASWDIERRFPRISIPGVALIQVYLFELSSVSRYGMQLD